MVDFSEILSIEIDIIFLHFLLLKQDLPLPQFVLFGIVQHFTVIWHFYPLEKGGVQIDHFNHDFINK